MIVFCSICMQIDEEFLWKFADISIMSAAFIGSGVMHVCGEGKFYDGELS